MKIDSKTIAKLNAIQGTFYNIFQKGSVVEVDFKESESGTPLESFEAECVLKFGPTHEVKFTVSNAKLGTPSATALRSALIIFRNPECDAEIQFEDDQMKDYFAEFRAKLGL